MALGPFTGIQNRVQDCRKRVNDLRKEFDTAVLVDIRREGACIVHYISPSPNPFRVVVATRAEIVLAGLSPAKDATWNPSLACMEGTRSSLLENISSWIHTDSEVARILLLTAPPGAGKTAIAHTVARDATETTVTLSFFFDRTSSDRNNPRQLVSTLVRDLAGHDLQFRTSVHGSLDRHRDLPSAQPLRQFTELLVGHASRITAQRIFIVIDALDECSGYRDDLTAIFCEQVPKLPSSFRIFITSRPEDPLIRLLKPHLHVRQVKVELDETENRSDISNFIRHRLRTIASHYCLGDSWPGEEKSSAVVARAAGLFAWASLAMAYIGRDKLMQRDKKLDAVIGRGTRPSPIAPKMDELYDTVLSACDWEDDDFLHGYHFVVGAMVAAKEPLSKSALRSLLEDSANLTDDVLDIVSPLFTSVDTEDEPIHLLHLTLYDFLTDAVRSKNYFIDEAEHSRFLGLKCLNILVRTLKAGIPGQGYSSSWDEYAYQPIPSFSVPTSVAYACRFWMDHIVRIQVSSDKECYASLVEFSPHVILWLEIASALGPVPALGTIRGWLEVCVDNTIKPLLKPTNIYVCE